MPSLDKRLTKLEDAFLIHLAESGEIRSDLKWLKRAFWALAGLGTTVAGYLITDAIRNTWR